MLFSFTFAFFQRMLVTLDIMRILQLIFFFIASLCTFIRNIINPLGALLTFLFLRFSCNSEKILSGSFNDGGKIFLISIFNIKAFAVVSGQKIFSIFNIIHAN